MGIKAHFLKDNNGNKFYPYAHASAVFDSNGQKIENRLNDLDINKIDKQVGKSLSSNDYTDEEKSKLASIQSNAEQNVQSDWNEIDSTSDSYIKNKPTSLPSNGGNSDTVNGHTVNSDVPANAKFTDTVYDDSSLSSKVTQNTNDISVLKTADNVLSSRIDTFTSLTEGSTTGDAELIDIRVGSNGTLYNSAGNAVREQFVELKNYTKQLNFKIGLVVSMNDILFEFNTDSNIITIPSKTYLMYKEQRYQLTAGDYVYNITNKGQIYLVYDTSDNSTKVVGYTDYVETMIVAFEFPLDDAKKQNENMITIKGKYKINGVEYPKKAGKIVDDGFVDSSVGTLFNFDELFTHTNPINVYLTGSGYTTDFDILSQKKTITNAVYISPDGSDLNSGVQYSPFLTIERCISSGADTIYFANGTYYLGTNFSNKYVFRNTINLICPDGEAVLFFGDKATNKIDSTSSMYIKNSCYIEGLTFIGGDGLYIQTSGTCALNRCKFKKARKKGLNFKGTSIYVFNCEASDNYSDGFSYHALSDAVRPTGVVEINCKGFRNGCFIEGASDYWSYNGSTIHEGGRIIRLNSEFGYCHGGVIADSSSMSYNFGIYAHDSTNNLSGYEHYNANFDALTYSTIWLYGCRGSGSRYHISSNQGSYIVRDIEITSDKIYNDGTAYVCTQKEYENYTKDQRSTE